MEAEKYILSEISKGTRHIQVPEAFSGKYILEVFLAKGMITSRANKIVTFEDGTILNSYSITEKGKQYLEEMV